MIVFFILNYVLPIQLFKDQLDPVARFVVPSRDHVEENMNHVIIAGHLGADPEVRFTSSGEKVTTLRVAARARRKDKTIWWKVTVWGEQFDKMMPYFKKGSSIFVMGEMGEPEIFTDRAGNPQPSMSLTAYNLSFSPFGRPDGAGGSDKAGPDAAHPESHPESSAPVTQGQGKGVAFSDEEAPF